MQLEDHLGDILRKARTMNNVSASASATAAGISESELAALESSGQCTTKINFLALANALGLDAKKLEGIANGWLPAKKDLSGWREIRTVTTRDTDGMSVNCYLVWDDVQRDAAA